MPTPLGFIEGRDFWLVNPSGNWSEDNATGRQHAADLLAHMKAQNAANLLGSVVRAMVERGRFGGIEAGFCAAISALALRGLR